MSLKYKILTIKRRVLRRCFQGFSISTALITKSLRVCAILIIVHYYGVSSFILLEIDMELDVSIGWLSTKSECRMWEWCQG